MDIRIVKERKVHELDGPVHQQPWWLQWPLYLAVMVVVALLLGLTPPLA